MPCPSAYWGHDDFEIKELISTVTYSNFTRRRGGLPSDDAIPTGGQLTRVARVAKHYLPGSSGHLVWSSRSFAEGEYNDICSTPAFGPMRVR